MITEYCVVRLKKMQFFLSPKVCETFSTSVPVISFDQKCFNQLGIKNMFQDLFFHRQ